MNDPKTGIDTARIVQDGLSRTMKKATDTLISVILLREGTWIHNSLWGRITTPLTMPRLLLEDCLPAKKGSRGNRRFPGIGWERHPSWAHYNTTQAKTLNWSRIFSTLIVSIELHTPYNWHHRLSTLFSFFVFLLVAPPFLFNSIDRYELLLRGTRWYRNLIQHLPILGHPILGNPALSGPFHKPNDRHPSINWPICLTVLGRESSSEQKLTMLSHTQPHPQFHFGVICPMPLHADLSPHPCDKVLPL